MIYELSKYVTPAQIVKLNSFATGYITVSSYGAKGDGVTDDTAAVQSAVNEANSTGITEVHFVNGKTYKITSLSNTTGISFVGNSVTITGGASITVLNFAGHVATTNPHSAVSAATANRIILRDSNGRAKVAAPSDEDDIALKSNVTTVQADLNTHKADSTHEVNILDYDNLVVASNWTAAINAAIASLSGGAGTIFFPKGTYTFSQFYLPSQTRLKGEGIGQSILSYAYDAESTYTASNRAITMGDRVTGDFGAGSYYNNLEQITITNAGNTTDGSTGFYATMRYNRWSHVQVSNFQVLFDMYNAWTNVFTNCEFSLCTNILTNTAALNATGFKSCYLGGCVEGFLISEYAGIVFDNCDIEAVTNAFIVKKEASYGYSLTVCNSYIEIAGDLIRQDLGVIFGLQLRNNYSIMLEQNLIFKGVDGTLNEGIVDGCELWRFGADTTPFFKILTGQYFTFKDNTPRKFSDYGIIDIVTVDSYAYSYVIENTEYPNQKHFNGTVKADKGFVVGSGASPVDQAGLVFYSPTYGKLYLANEKLVNGEVLIPTLTFGTTAQRPTVATNGVSLPHFHWNTETTRLDILFSNSDFWIDAMGTSEYTVTYDPPSLAAGATTSTTISAGGVALGHYVIVNFSLDLQGLVMTAYVSAANVITVVLYNPTAGVIDLGSGTLKAKYFL